MSLYVIPKSWTRLHRQNKSQESLSSILWDTWHSVHPSNVALLILHPSTSDAAGDSGSPPPSPRHWAPRRRWPSTACHCVAQHRERHLTLTWINNKMSKWMDKWMDEWITAFWSQGCFCLTSHCLVKKEGHWGGDQREVQCAGLLPVPFDLQLWSMTFTACWAQTAFKGYPSTALPEGRGDWMVLRAHHC